jgi:hypothetical protein
MDSFRTAGLFAIAIFFTHQGFAQPPQVSQRITGVVELIRLESGEIHGYLDLPPLDAGERYELSLTIKNRTQERFAFVTVNPGCNCYSFKVPFSGIDARESAEATVEFQVPQYSPKSSYSVGAEFVGKKNAVVGRVSATGSIRGNLFVEHPESVRLRGRQISEIMLPVIFSAPIKSQDLVVSGQDSFGDLEVVGQIVAGDEGSFFLKVLVQNRDRDGSAIGGTLKIKDSVSEKAIEVPLLLIEQAAVEILPVISTFRQKSQKEADPPVLDCLLKFDEMVVADSVAEKQGEEHGVDLSVMAKIKGIPLKLKIDKLSRKVYRVHVEAPEELVSGDDLGDSIEWNVQVNAREFNILTQFRFDRE